MFLEAVALRRVFLQPGIATQSFSAPVFFFVSIFLSPMQICSQFDSRFFVRPLNGSQLANTSSKVGAKIERNSSAVCSIAIEVHVKHLLPIPVLVAVILVRPA